MPESIQIQGYAEFRRGLLQLDKEWSASEGLKRVGNRAADLVVDWAVPRIPRRSGRTAASVKATSSATVSKVTGGGARVPWYPWIDFGGSVGRKRSVRRAFLPDGRFIYPGFAARRDEITAVLTTEMRRIVGDLGWDVTNG